ncbi:hypothetical protein DY000_02029989 [Brassica cretica]|uniref:Uncharacterized protein n=1 Tax=Brassica cretica TaxID=69181 RepID=A0ABQ7DT42_BRACR|nr:hypothetical protein DY000_02029989 [Brassica cretica]
MITETFLSVALFEEASGDLSLYRSIDEEAIRGRLCLCIIRWFDEEASHRFLRQQTARSSYSHQTVSGNFEDSVELSSSQVPILGLLHVCVGVTRQCKRVTREETVQVCHASGDSEREKQFLCHEQAMCLYVLL